MFFRLGSAILLWGLLAAAANAQLPMPVLPDGLGVNIHFTDPRPGEMEMLAAGGFRWVRMDFSWGATEREQGQYDFQAYDRLLAALTPHKIRALLILDYSNRRYDNGLSPSSAEGRAAFARWAAAAAQHFRGRGILWEMYNEPNIGFWKPHPDPAAYVQLALEVGRALRQAAPDEAYIGPATSTIDFAFLEQCFRAGLLEYWSGVSVHPYRQKGPKTAAAEYARLRTLIEQYAPQGKPIPILSGEWGYSSAWKEFDDVRQGKLLPRQWLVNLACDVPLSIWYDWHDDGTNPKEPEHHFGTTANRYFADRRPVYDPKPAYLAAQTLTTQLAGFRFNKRLAVGDASDYLLLFSRPGEARLAAWTTVQEPHAVLIPASPGRFRAIAHTGQALPPLVADERGLSATLSDAPQYLVPESPNALLTVAAAWERLPPAMRMPAQKQAAISLSLENPLREPLGVSAGPASAQIAPGARAALATRCDLPRSADPVPLTVQWTVAGLGRIAQHTELIAANPLRVVLLPVATGMLPVRVENPSGEPFRGSVMLTDVEGLRFADRRTPLELSQGQGEALVRFACEPAAAKTYRLGLRVDDERGEAQVVVPASRYTPVDAFGRYTAETLAQAYHLAADGDRQVQSQQSLTLAAPPEGPPAPAAGVLKISYRMEKGWKFLRLAPRLDALRAIEGRPTGLGLWIYGDGQGTSPRLRLLDATGQCFQLGGERIGWQGWRYVVVPLDFTHAGHWGGANDGVVHDPLRWDSLLLLDKGRAETAEGAIYVSSPVLIR